MAFSSLRSSNSRYVATGLVLGVLLLEAAIGGRALTALVQQAVSAQSSFLAHAAFGD